MSDKKKASQPTQPSPYSALSDKVAYCTATFFYAGTLKPAPGTWGALAAALAAWPLMHMNILWFGVIVSTVIGWWACHVLYQMRDIKDPGWIVIDEVAGMWLTMLFVPPSWFLLMIGFGLFRLFDIWKPWPVSWGDRRPGPFAVMLDDLIAGVYAGGILWLFHQFFLS